MAGFEGLGGRKDYRAYATMETDGINTQTSRQQVECERKCELSFLPLQPGELDEEDMEGFRDQGIINAAGEPVLMRDKHAAYLLKGLAGLGPGFISLDASRPWMVYWIMHSLDLLDRLPIGGMTKRVIGTLAACQDKVKGGFGGGPQQLPHCAPMYAAVLSLLLIGTPESYAAIDRHALYCFFLSLKHRSGGFMMHDDGEVDARGTYTVIAVASLLNVLTPELSEGVVEFIVRCQTYEGGFGAEPWNEAHGGYTFCAFASLVILGQSHRANLDALRRWLCGRQMRAEGGFQGRTNKLVDGCYTFWQGSAVALLDYARAGREAEECLPYAQSTHVIDCWLYGLSQSPVEHFMPLFSWKMITAVYMLATLECPDARSVLFEVSHRDVDGKIVRLSDIRGEDSTRSHDRAHVDDEGVSNTRQEQAQRRREGKTANPDVRGQPAGDSEGGIVGELDVREAVRKRVSRDNEACESGLEFDRADLQEYVLMCSQQPNGGLRDKPGKQRDFYHTCYTLSGLSVAQHCLAERPVIVGDESNELKPTNAAYNIAEEKVVRAVEHFGTMASDHAFLTTTSPS